MRAGSAAMACLALLVSGGTDAVAQIGGACSYAAYPGTCRIVAVGKTPASIAQRTIVGGPGYEGFEVTFAYASTGAAPPAAAQRSHRLTLTNSWYPGAKFLAKYDIRPGQHFACTLKVITRGACTPLLFDFPTVDRSDYFETGR